MVSDNIVLSTYKKWWPEKMGINFTNNTVTHLCYSCYEKFFLSGLCFDKGTIAIQLPILEVGLLFWRLSEFSFHNATRNTSYYYYASIFVAYFCHTYFNYVL